MNTTANTNTLSGLVAWHAMPQAEVVERLVTNSEKGLNLSEASARLQQYGPNRLQKARSGVRSRGSSHSSTIS